MERDNNIHVVLLPFLAFGHMRPFHQLAICLAKAGVRVSYVSTPKNIQRLPKAPPSLAPLLNFVEIPLPAVDHLPEGAEATSDIPVEMSKYLTMAYDLLQQPFKQFVAEHSPDWIIIDFPPYWAVEVARDCGVPLLCFSAFSAATKVFFGPPEHLAGDGQKRVRSSIESLTSPPPWVSFPSSVAFRYFEAIRSFHYFYGSASGLAVSPAQRVATSLQGCQAVAIRSCREIEGEYLSLFAKLLGKPVIPVGLILPEPSEQKETHDETWTQIFKWLDEQQPKSVVFVGFGSECTLSKEQVYELAYGLEASELHFLWVMRKPSWATDDADALPPSFSHRTSHKGKVCIGWAPQMDILAHPSVGGALFHAGWSSAAESLKFGHSMVVLPLAGDQSLNARCLVENGLAIEVERGEEDGSFSRNDIAKSLRQAMVSKEGDEMRARSGVAAAQLRDQKLQKEYFDEFVKYLKSGVANQK